MLSCILEKVACCIRVHITCIICTSTLFDIVAHMNLHVHVHTVFERIFGHGDVPLHFDGDVVLVVCQSAVKVLMHLSHTAHERLINIVVEDQFFRHKQMPKKLVKPRY